MIPEDKEQTAYEMQFFISPKELGFMLGLDRYMYPRDCPEIADPFAKSD